MAETLEELVVKIRADNQQFSKEVLKLQSQVKQMAGSVDTASKRFGNLTSAWGLAKNILAGSGLVQGVQVLGQALKATAAEAIGFETGITEINSILPETAQLTEETTQAIRDFSNQFGTSQTAQTKAFYQIVSAGVTDAAKATKLLEQANKAAVAGLTSTQSAINGLTSVLAVYEKRGIDAEMASDILFATVREGKTTFGELSANVGKVSAIAETAGVSFSDLSGSLAFLTKSGISTEEATTGLRAVISGIIKPTDEAKAAAAELGIQLDTAALSSKGFAQFFSELNEAVDGNVDALSRIFPNILALNAAAQLAGTNVEDLGNILDRTANAAGNTEAAYVKFADTTKQKLDIAQANLTVLGTTLVELVLPALGDAAKAFNDLFSEIRATSAAMDEIAKPADTAAAKVNKLENQLFLAQQRLEQIQDAANFRGFVDESALAEQKSLIANLEEQLVRAQQDAVKEQTRIARQGAENVIDIERALTEEQLAEIEKRKQAQQALAQVRQDIRQKEKDAEVQTLAELLEADTQDKEKKKEREQGFFDEMFEKRAENNEAELEQLNEKKKREQEIIDEALAAGTINQEEAAKARNASEAKFEKELSEIKEAENKQRAQDQRDTLNTIATLTSSSNKTLKAIGKAAAITTATQDGIVAVQKALASAPPPLNYGLAAAVGAATAQNVARIAGLQSGIDSVPGVGTADNFPALLAPGERVVPTKTNQDLTKFLARERNSSGGGGPVIHITVQEAFGVDAETIGEKIVESINAASDRSGVKIFREAVG